MKCPFCEAEFDEADVRTQEAHLDAEHAQQMALLREEAQRRELEGDE